MEISKGDFIMEYRLTLIHNDNSFTDIDGLSTLPGFDTIDETSLKDIVKFTSSFENDIELKEFLLFNGLIDKNFLDSEFGINFYKGKNNLAKTLPYGISYKAEKKFFDFNYLLSFYLYRQQDLNFMNSFLTTYYQKLKDIPIFSDLYYIKHSYDYLYEHDYLPTEANAALESFLHKYVYQKDKNGIKQPVFSRIRELAMLAINYERKRKNKKQDNIIDMINELKMELLHYKDLLSNSAINDEQRDIYNKEVLKLERIIKDYE